MKVTELTRNKTETFQLLPTNETSLKYVLHNIKTGGHYNISIMTDYENSSQSSSLLYNGPHIFPPHQLNVLFENDHYLVYWQMRHQVPSISGKYHYEVLVNEQSHHMDEKTAMKFEVDQPPFTYNNAKKDASYAFAVRLVTEEGLKSPLSEVFSLFSPQSKYN